MTIAIVALLVLLPFAYFLSFGPLAWLNQNGYIDANGPAGQGYAWPLQQVTERSPKLKALMIRYLLLWIPPP